MNYSDFQSKSASEKIALAFMNAAKQLMGWSVHSGSVYSLPFTPQVIVSIADSGTPYTAVASLGAIAAGKYYLDRVNGILYIQTSDSSNPNGKFLACVVQFFFANVPITLPYDLNTGFEVPFEPLISQTSNFGVSIDTVNQVSEMVEGTGSISLQNDYDFWPKNFDKYYFENQSVAIYSYNRNINDPSQAQIIFKGQVLKKTYSTQTIDFDLQDLFLNLRATIPLNLIGDLGGARVDSNLALAKQRLILGRVFGHRPTNIDQVLTGYPVTGTVSITSNTTALTGAGTHFLNELSPDDQITLNGVLYTIASVTDDTDAVLTQPYTSGATLSGVSTTQVPKNPKRFMNRIFNVAGHALREPSTLTESGCTVQRLNVNNTTDFYAGDIIYVGTLGSGEVATISEVTGSKYILLSTSLATAPGVGVMITRPAIQNVRIADTLLDYYRDYTFDATTATLTLLDIAEANAAPIYQVAQNATFTNTSRTVTGSGTSFKNTVKPGDMVGVVGEADFFEVSSVDSDTQLTLKTASTYTNTAAFQYQNLVYDEGKTVLTCDCFGKTDDGTTTGPLSKTGPSISKKLLNDAGLGSFINTSSFSNAEDIAYQHLGVVIPAKYDDKTDSIYRDVLNTINTSVFGTLFQDSNFNFGYHVLRPNKNPAALIFRESDILSWTVNSTAETAIDTTIVQYLQKEYDWTTQAASYQTKQTTSNISSYLLNLSTSKTYVTYIVDPTAAQLMSDRLSFVLSNAIGTFQFNTKLQAMKLQIGDIIEVNHRKMFQRFGGNVTRRLMMVEGVQRSGSDVQINATDLSNSFNRVCAINNNSNPWTSASDTELLYGGYVTDQYGLINNDEQSFGTNVIF